MSLNCPACKQLLEKYTQAIELAHKAYVATGKHGHVDDCYCPEGQCMAPVIMGMQMPCIRMKAKEQR